jgi:cytoskeleton protein RodZ
MTLAELGAALRAEREKCGLTIDAVANHLKIGVPLLRAIEEGDESALPPLAYAKGFLRSYAAYVGLPEEDVSSFTRKLDEEAEQAASQTAMQPIILLAPRRNFRFLFIILALLCIALLAYVLWRPGTLEYLEQQTQRLAQPAEDLRTAEPAPQVQPETAVPQTDALPEPAQAPVPGADLSGDATADPAASTAENTPVQNSSTEEPVSDTPAPGERTQGPHKVVLTASEECWVHSTADNTDTRQFSLRKGDVFALTFNTALELKLGNAGGVRIRYNGREMPLAGQKGQVRTVTFPPPASHD